MTIAGSRAVLVAAIEQFAARHAAIEAGYIFELFRIAGRPAEANSTRLVIEWIAPLERLRSGSDPPVTSGMLADLAACQADAAALVDRARQIIDWRFSIDLRHPMEPTDYDVAQLRSLRADGPARRKIWVIS